MTDEEAAEEIINDLTGMLQENGIYNGDPWLLWRFLFDDDVFHVTAGRVIKEHESGLNSSGVY